MKYNILKIVPLFFLIIFEVYAEEQNFRCFGTEPFWSMRLIGNEIIFSDITNKYTLARPKSITAAGFTPGFIYFYEIKQSEANNPATITIIRDTKCSDGMSDELFEYEVIIRNLPEKDFLLYGCCK